MRQEEMAETHYHISKSTACFMLDLNDLKKVNDTLGHGMGDIMILNFAKLLRLRLLRRLPRSLHLRPAARGRSENVRRQNPDERRTEGKRKTREEIRNEGETKFERFSFVFCTHFYREIIF